MAIIPIRLLCQMQANYFEAFHVPYKTSEIGLFHV